MRFISSMHNSKQLSTSVTKNMSNQKSNQALLVLLPSKNHRDEAIDLSLRLSIMTTGSTSNAMNFKNSKKRSMSSREDDDQEDSMLAKRLEKFKIYTREEEAEENLYGVCTKLKLYDDPWKIKKVLETSDVNGSSRLMISKRLVQQHIVKVWERAGRYQNVRDLDEFRDVHVKVWDCDRREEYELTMKKHVSSNCYVFCTKWTSEFVSARGLKKGDEIGLFWCTLSENFYFSVLARRAPHQPSI